MATTSASSREIPCECVPPDPRGKVAHYHTIQDDVRNAGGNWVDRPVAEV
jgi:hypothetical protein